MTDVTTLRENVSTMYEVFRDAIGNQLYTSLRASLRTLLKVHAMIHVAENLGEAPAVFEQKRRRVTSVTRLIRKDIFTFLASVSRNT